MTFMDQTPFPASPPTARRAERVAYRNQWITVFDDDVMFADGREGTYLRIEPAVVGQGVVVAPRRKDEYAVVLTYRYPIGQWQFAFPRGFSHGPDARESAEMELLEETGLVPERLELLGSVTPDSGLFGGSCAMFLAEIQDDAVATPRDVAEVQNVRWVHKDQLRRDAGDGRLQDGFTMATIAVLLSSGRF